MAKEPSFFKSDSIMGRRKAMIAEAREEGLIARAKLGPASKDKVKRIAVGIDLQVDFISEDGTLKVGGAIDDTKRFIKYLYGNAENISGLLFSLDQHLPWQIFFPIYWKNVKTGKHPDPFTPMLSESIYVKGVQEDGVWEPQLKLKRSQVKPNIPKGISIDFKSEDWSLSYAQILQATGQNPLVIWPEHCMIGTDGAALVPDLAEAIEWICAARGIQPIFMFKGTVPESEHYGPFCPCVEISSHASGGLQTGFMDIVANYDAIDVAGQAEDFCVREGMRQLLKYYGTNRPDVLKKMRFLSDCTSLVFPDKRAEADNVLDDYISKGVQVVKSTEI